MCQVLYDNKLPKILTRTCWAIRPFHCHPKRHSWLKQRWQTAVSVVSPGPFCSLNPPSPNGLAGMYVSQLTTLTTWSLLSIILILPHPHERLQRTLPWDWKMGFRRWQWLRQNFGANLKVSTCWQFPSWSLHLWSSLSTLNTGTGTHQDCCLPGWSSDEQVIWKTLQGERRETEG